MIGLWLDSVLRNNTVINSVTTIVIACVGVWSRSCAWDVNVAENMRQASMDAISAHALKAHESADPYFQVH